MWTIILIIFIALALLTGGGILGWILQGVQAIFSLLWYGVGALLAFGLKLIIVTYTDVGRHI